MGQEVGGGGGEGGGGGGGSGLLASVDAVAGEETMSAPFFFVLINVSILIRLAEFRVPLLHIFLMCLFGPLLLVV
jgi:hypothetical protein